MRFEGFGITPAWSLCVEMVFYLCLPLLALGMLSISRRRAWTTRAVLAPVVVMVVVGVAAKIVGHLAHLGAVWEMSFPVHADWFAMGMALAVLHAAWENGRLRVTARARGGAIILAVALSVIATKALAGGELDFVDSQTLMALACALLLGFVVFAPADALTVRVLDSRILAAAGLWSYGIFLWQYPVINELRNRGLTRDGVGGFLFNLGLVLLVTVVLSAITYRFVERPALRRKRSSQLAAVAVVSGERSTAAPVVASSEPPAAAPAVAAAPTGLTRARAERVVRSSRRPARSRLAAGQRELTRQPVPLTLELVRLQALLFERRGEAGQLDPEAFASVSRALSGEPRDEELGCQLLRLAQRARSRRAAIGDGEGALDAVERALPVRHDDPKHALLDLRPAHLAAVSPLGVSAEVRSWKAVHRAPMRARAPGSRPGRAGMRSVRLRCGWRRRACGRCWSGGI